MLAVDALELSKEDLIPGKSLDSTVMFIQRRK